MSDFTYEQIVTEALMLASEDAKNSPAYYMDKAKQLLKLNLVMEKINEQHGETFRKLADL